MNIFRKKKDNQDMNEENKNTNPENPQDNSVSAPPEEEILRTAAQAAGADDNSVATDERAADADNKSDSADNGKDDRKHNDNDADIKIQEMGEKLATLNDKYVRLYSEYENYRKRTNQEKADLLLNGGKDVLKAILPIVDDMERALKNIPDDNIAKEGVQLVYNKLKTTLAQRGVKEIEAQGQRFDESLHEAVTRIPAPEEALKGTVLDVVEKGYMLNDKVLRFPKVVVGC